MMRGSLTGCGRKTTIYHFYYFITKGQYRKQKKIIVSSKSEAQHRETKLVNLNSTQNQPRNYLLHTRAKKGRAV